MGADRCENCQELLVDDEGGADEHGVVLCDRCWLALAEMEDDASDDLYDGLEA